MLDITTELKGLRLRGMVERVRGRENDDGLAGSADSSLPYRGNG